MYLIGGRLGVCKGVLCMWFCERCVAGLFGWIFLGRVNGYELRESGGFFLGNF